ncbi:MAG: hypothetical protein L0Z50_33660 [Verrucomicrobiales bacterium]|nr:hypothetical protein [Verrucomicrobiales bacterium]
MAKTKSKSNVEKRYFEWLARSEKATWKPDQSLAHERLRQIEISMLDLAYELTVASGTKITKRKWREEFGVWLQPEPGEPAYETVSRLAAHLGYEVGIAAKLFFEGEEGDEGARSRTSREISLDKEAMARVGDTLARAGAVVSGTVKRG